MGEDRGLALVTGASRGIGAATVRALAAASFRVLANLPPHADAALVELSPTDQAVGGSVFAERRDRSSPGAA
jgi:NAD(P)-dependent dehydrogenase (short-subunit alcohol dehydrogenase family)